MRLKICRRYKPFTKLKLEEDATQNVDTIHFVIVPAFILVIEKIVHIEPGTELFVNGKFNPCTQVCGAAGSFGRISFHEIWSTGKGTKVTLQHHLLKGPPTHRRSYFQRNGSPCLIIVTHVRVTIKGESAGNGEFILVNVTDICMHANIIYPAFVAYDKGLAISGCIIDVERKVFIPD